MGIKTSLAHNYIRTQRRDDRQHNYDLLGIENIDDEEEEERDVYNHHHHHRHDECNITIVRQLNSTMFNQPTSIVISLILDRSVSRLRNMYWIKVLIFIQSTSTIKR